MPAGRPPKPTAKLKLHNTYRADRRHADEPDPDVCIPKKPVFLKGPAAKEWKRITIELQQMKLISQIDMAALAGYCHAFGEVVRLEKQLVNDRKNCRLGDLIMGAKGGWVLNPLIKARNASWKMVLEFGREFGLSPVSRTRISTGQADDKNPFADFISNAG